MKDKATGFPVIPETFYSRETVEVARELLGKWLVVYTARGKLVGGGPIVETEAYSGTDPASHSARGKTPRCAPMFEEPGRAYVYFIYGVHEMLNFVTEPVGEAGAVLIRAVDIQLGEGSGNGPGKLTRALGVTRADNRAPLQGPRLCVVDPGGKAPRVLSSPRVGISQGLDKYWRFFIEGHPQVSRVKENKIAR